MVVPVLIAVGSVLAGALLGVGSQRGRASGSAWTTEGASALATFALVSALAVVLAQLLPDALAGAGLAALAVFGVAAALPALFERLAARVTPGRAVDRVGLELGYAALALHQAGDGVALGTYGGSHHAGHGHFDILFAIAAHTVPMIALVSIAFFRVGGARVAAVRAVGLALASTIGVVLPEVMPTELFERVEPWLTAAVAGLLLHVVAHDWSASRNDTPVGRVIDLVAVAGAAGLVALSGHDHHGDTDVRERIGAVLVDLSLRVAPALLIGLALSALVATWLGPRVSTGALARRGRLHHALRGAWLGASRPLATARALAGGRALEARGATPALVVAFLFAGPTLGLETFAVTAELLGGPFAIARAAVAGALAIGIAIVIDVAARPRAARDAVVDDVDALAEAAPEDVGGYPSALLRNFDALLHDVAPWTVVGLLAAAYVGAVLEPDLLPPLRAQGLDVLVVPLVALPAYVSAPAATPLAVVLLLGGMSPGAVLAGLVLGPITHLTHIAFVRVTWGARAAGIGVLALVGSAIGVAVLFDAGSGPLVPARDVAPSAASIAAATALGLAILYRIWRTGVRTWIASVGAWARSDAESAHQHGPREATPRASSTAPRNDRRERSP